jgi:hypothetical protein
MRVGQAAIPGIAGAHGRRHPGGFMVVANRQHWRRRAFRIAAWLALALVIAIALHYAEKYEGDMLTDHFQTTVTLPDTPRPKPIIVD